MKMKIKMKNRSHRYDKNRPRSSHRHRYSQYKKCLTMMILTCINRLMPGDNKKVSHTYINL